MLSPSFALQRRQIIGAMVCATLAGCSNGSTSTRNSNSGGGGAAGAGGILVSSGGVAGSGVQPAGAGGSAIGRGGAAGSVPEVGDAGVGGKTSGSGGATMVVGGGAPGVGGVRAGSGGSSVAASSTSAGAGGTSAGSGGSATGGLSVLSDTNRDGVVDDKDTAGFTEWAWKSGGAFFLANVDDDDKKGKVDSSDQIVNGTADEDDLARIIVKVSADMLAKTSSISASVTTGATQTHLFEKTSSSWKLVSGAVTQVAAQVELGIEALQFADTNWDGFAVVKIDLLDSGKVSIASQQVKMRVAPWIMLPQSAKTEALYISSSTSRLRPDLNKTLESKSIPAALASNPGSQDIWFQDTMEIGYTQLPGKPPMHVVMNGVRPNASDNVAITLLAPDFGFIKVGTVRQPANEEDHWMDWMGDLEVTHPVSGYPLGRIYYGKSDRTTFSPTIVKFLEAQQVQKPFAVYTNWLIIQHVDEVENFLVDQNGKAKMIIVSPAAANTVMGSGYDAGNQQIQKYIDDDIAQAKTELGLTDADIIQLPTFFNGSGSNYGPNWSNPVNSVYANGTFMIGNDSTPAPVKSDIEKKLAEIGVQVAWVDDSEYYVGMGDVHCATNTKKTPVCANFTDCLMAGLTP
jgi:protein-arginine deiminase